MKDNYEHFESLGAHHPIQVEVTVAQAEERERAGIPLPISGDPESEFTYELLAIRRARLEKEAAAAAPRVVTAIPCGHYADGSPIRRHTFELVREPEPFGEGKSRLWGIHVIAKKRFGLTETIPKAVVWTDSIEPAPLPPAPTKPRLPSRSGIWPTLAHEPVPALAGRPRVVIAGWIQGGPLPVAS